MTRGGRRRTAGAMTCLSCGALLDSLRSFCDPECEKYARLHGYGHYGEAKQNRGIPHHHNKVRKIYRRNDTCSGS